MSEWTGVFIKQIQVFFPILEDFAIQQDWEVFLPLPVNLPFITSIFLKSLLLSQHPAPLPKPLRSLDSKET